MIGQIISNKFEGYMLYMLLLANAIQPGDMGSKVTGIRVEVDSVG